MRTSMQLVCSEEASSGIWRLRELASFLVLSFSYGNSVMIQFNCRFTILFSVVEREEGEMGERREKRRQVALRRPSLRRPLLLPHLVSTPWCTPPSHIQLIRPRASRTPRSQVWVVPLLPPTPQPHLYHPRPLARQ
jgi:hypothetical protein